MSIQGTPTSGIRWIVDSTGAIVGYRNPVSDQDATYTANTSYTAAQLSALAAAGGLTAGATYIASDTGRRMDATSASRLVRANSDGKRPKLAAIGDSITAMYNFSVLVQSLSRLGGVLTVGATTHNLYRGALFRLDGLAWNGFDPSVRGVYKVATVIDANTFTALSPGPDGAIAVDAETRFYNLQRCTNNSGLNWMQIHGGYAFDVVGLFATYSERAVYMQSRLAEVAASDADYCWILGGINDILNAGESAAVIIAALRALIAAVRNMGVRPIVCTLPPFAGTAWSAEKAKTQAQVNASLRADCLLNGDILCDLYAALVDPMNASNGIAKTSYVVANSAHLTQRGAYYAGKRAWADISAATGIVALDDRVTSNADNFGFDSASNNVFDFAPWTNSGGTVTAPVTGTFPLGWTATRQAGSCAIVASAPARADGFGYDAKMVITPAASGDYANIGNTYPGWGTRISSGVPYEILATLTITGLPGSTLGFCYQNLSGTIDGATVQYIATGLYPTESTPLNEDFSFPIRVPKFTVDGTMTGNLTLSFVSYFTGSGSAVSVSVGRVSIRGPGQ